MTAGTRDERVVREMRMAPPRTTRGDASGIATGPLVLLGGGEHRTPCEPIDRWLLDRTGASRPVVAIIPAASVPGTTASTAALARSYWAGLGARAVIVAPRGAQSRSLEEVTGADAIVLTGGVPNLLVSALGASPLWDAVLDRWRAGAGLSGSSAGAMALFDWRLRLRPPAPLGLVPGLGPLTGQVVVPHFERLVVPVAVMRRLVRRAHERYEGRPILGIDEHTALVSHEGSAHVMGMGGIDVVGPSGWHRHPVGAEVPAPTMVGAAAWASREAVTGVQLGAALQQAG